MHCSVENGNVRYHEFCDRPPEWVVETLGLGYPNHELTPVAREVFCSGHFIQKMIDVNVERVATTAGLRVIRLAHWARTEEARRLEGR